MSRPSVSWGEVYDKLHEKYDISNMSKEEAQKIT